MTRDNAFDVAGAATAAISCAAALASTRPRPKWLRPRPPSSPSTPRAGEPANVAPSAPFSGPQSS